VLTMVQVLEAARSCTGRLRGWLRAQRGWHRKQLRRRSVCAALARAIGARGQAVTAALAVMCWRR